MKIRNESKRTYFFNGGCIRPNEVCDIKDEAIATALIINYPTEIICLDTLEARVVEAKSDDNKLAQGNAAPKGKKAKSDDNKLAQGNAATISKVEVKVN